MYTGGENGDRGTGPRDRRGRAKFGVRVRPTGASVARCLRTWVAIVALGPFWWTDALLLEFFFRVGEIVLLNERCVFERWLK